MDYSSGAAYGYDQIYPNMLLDNYDAPYSQNTVGHRPPCPNERPNRTIIPPPDERPIASYADLADRPRVPLDSELIGRRGCRKCGARAPLQTVFSGPDPAILKEGFLSMPGSDMEGFMAVLMFVLLIVIIINGINLRHLQKQVKLLSQANQSAATLAAI